jgi:hypothetical protein
MKCTCERARREARAEAFEEARDLHIMHRDMFRRDFGPEDEVASMHEWSANHFSEMAAKERAACAPKPPVRYTEAPEPQRASEGLWSAREGLSDCVEDGWTTAHVTGWPDSYPFEALDPWPGADGGRDGA